MGTYTHIHTHTYTTTCAPSANEDNTQYTMLAASLRHIANRTAVRSSATTVTAVRDASTLIVVEHDNETVSAEVNKVAEAAKAFGGDVTALVAGTGCQNAAAHAAKIEGIDKVLIADHDAFKGFLPEAVAPAVLATQSTFNFSHILAPSSAFGKGVLPRVAASLDVDVVSDVTKVNDERSFERLIYAGNAVQTVKTEDSVVLASVRGTCFDAAAETGSASSDSVDGSACAQDKSVFVSQELSKSDRPSLAAATRVVAGGRALKSTENFELMYKLADKMGAAVGASRAAVDAGYVPNDMQIGQTGKVVAPELYVAVGISGAIQHLAGMKDSKTIVCINKDADAPIFQVSDYGLVADLFTAVPEMTEKL